MRIDVSPIAYVRNNRTEVKDDFWGAVRSEIHLAEGVPEEALHGLDAFSHVEVIFFFHGVAANDVVTGARHPRGNPMWPRVGIFAQRAKDRPNRLGLCTVRVAGCGLRVLLVDGLDAVDGTPVLDIKPVMREFLPQTPVVQPAWCSEIMKNYWFPTESP